MAKLSARGRTEVKRWTRETVILGAYPSPEYHSPVVKRVATLALMSDGKVLSKEKVWWGPSFYVATAETLRYGAPIGGVVEAPGMVHDYGWKVRGKLRPGADVGNLARTYEKMGYTEVVS